MIFGLIKGLCVVVARNGLIEHLLTSRAKTNTLECTTARKSEFNGVLTA